MSDHHYQQKALQLVSRGQVSRVAELLEVSAALAEALANLENDDGSIPKALWEKRNLALDRFRSAVSS